jgi:hypothetical protein
MELEKQDRHNGQDYNVNPLAKMRSDTLPLKGGSAVRRTIAWNRLTASYR